MLFYIYACKKNGCLVTPGKTVEKKLELPYYQTIILHDNINLILTHDSVSSAVLEGGKNLLPYVSVIVDNKSLIITNNAKCEWLRSTNAKLNLYLHVTNLDQILYYGYGNIRSTNILKADTFYLTSNEGAGNVDLQINSFRIYANINRHNASFKLSGKTNELSGFCDTRGSFDFSTLLVNKMSIWYAGVGDSKIFVTDTLRTVIYQTGNLLLRGSPPYIEKTYRGKGRLINY